MAKEYIYLQGKGNWIRLVKPNQWDKWSVQLHPTAEGIEKIRDLQAEGLKNVIKKDDDGYFINLNRPTYKDYAKTGKRQLFTAPEVVDKNGVPMDGSTVGNGSDLTVKMEVYRFTVPGTSSKSVAMRMEAVKVDNLVPFEPDRDFTDEEKEKIAGLSEQPEQLF